MGDELRSTAPEPDYGDPKEVYAFFGLAFYSASVLEQGLVNYAVALKAKGIIAVTVGQVQSLFTKFDENTFGQTLAAIRQQSDLPMSLERDLRTALEHRNNLAHHFWVEHDHSIMTDSGRRKMIDELRDIINTVKNVDRQFDDIWAAAWSSLGVSREWLDQQFENTRRRLT